MHVPLENIFLYYYSIFHIFNASISTKVMVVSSCVFFSRKNITRYNIVKCVYYTEISSLVT